MCFIAVEPEGCVLNTAKLTLCKCPVQFKKRLLKIMLGFFSIMLPDSVTVKVDCVLFYSDPV